MYKSIFYNLFSLNFDEFSIICFHLIYQFASVNNDVLHQSSDADIEFIDYDKLSTKCNNRRKHFWTKLENDGMLVSAIQVITLLNLYALLDLSVMHIHSVQ